jgi:2-methylcitrate dehydratase PrpD
MGATQVLAEYVSRTSFSGLSKEVVRKAKGIILDTLGCGIAGYTLAKHEFHWIFDLVKEMGGNPESTVFLEGAKTSSPQAALVNGTLIHTIDYDDTHMGSISHLGAPVVSTTLALGEKLGADGPSLITALVMAYEVAGRIGKAVMLSHYKYWHPTATFGTIAAGVASSKLLGMKAGEVDQAISLAADGAFGMRYCIDFGDFSKSFHPGLAAWHGIMAARVIGRGAVGPKGLLEYKSGFCEAYSDEPNIKALTENLGTFYETMADSLKAFPTILISHSPIQATMKLMKTGNLRPEDVQSIHLRITPTAPGQGLNYSPDSPLAARLSIPYCVGMAATDGHISMEQFKEDRIMDPKIREFMKKITVEPAPEFHQKYPGTLAAHVEIRTKDGSKFKEENIYPKGHPENPMSDEEIKEKFRRLALLTLNRAQTDQIIEKVYDLENMKQTKELIELLIKP